MTHHQHPRDPETLWPRAAQRVAWLTATSALGLALSACGGSDGADGRTALISTATLLAGAQCTSGGTAVSVGLDTNANGTLDEAEITSTRYVCNGAAGSAGADGAPGANGRNGSDGANGRNGSDGANGRNGSDGANGTNGTNGTNGSNGSNGANGANGLTALLQLTAEPAGANCAAGGTRVDAGADTNTSGVLDNSEITTTSYICNGGSAAWVSITSATQQAAVNSSYAVSRDGYATITLPATAAVGDTVAVIGATGGWKLAQNAQQTVLVSNASNVGSLRRDWRLSGAGTDNWNPVASDFSGTTLYAATGNSLQVSPDGGTSWIALGTDNENWRGLASSSDGLIAYAVSGSGRIYKTSNGGGNWSNLPSSPRGFLERVATSADGARVLVAGDRSGGSVYLSTDGGASFSPVPTPSAVGHWVSVSMSADGQTMLATQNATVGFDQTALSTDGGLSWTALPVPAGMHQTAVSGDGSTSESITYNGTDNTVYVSRNLGASWAAALVLPTSGAGNLLRTAISHDGLTITATADGGRAHASNNGGIDWSAYVNTGAWYGAAVAGNGSKVLNATVGGPILIATPGVAGSASTAGVGGSLSGSFRSGATLQYIGNNLWVMLSSIGKTFID